MKNIVIVNAHWNNRGDEAALRGIIDVIQQNYNSEIMVIFKDKGNIRQFPYSNVKYIVTRFLLEEVDMERIIEGKNHTDISLDIKKTMDIIDNADYVIYSPGGAVISDRFWWKKQLEYLFPIAYAEYIGKPVFFAAPSVGPFSENMIRRTDILNNVECLCVREEISKNELLKIGVKNVIVTIDSAFLNVYDENQLKLILGKDYKLNYFIHKYDKIVGVTITDFMWHVEYGKDDELKSNIMDTFNLFINEMNKQKIGVLLIPQLFGNQNDTELLKKFVGINTFVLNDMYDAFMQQYIISKLYCVVGMRYHSNIFSAKAGIPFIPIIYEEKMEGFLKKYNYIEYSIKLRELTPEKLLSTYNKLLKNYKFVKQYLVNKHVEWIRQADETKNLLVEFLK